MTRRPERRWSSRAPARWRAYIRGLFEISRAEHDDNAALVKKYKVNAIPCMVVIDGEGKEVGRLVGYRDAETFLKDAGKYIK